MERFHLKVGLITCGRTISLVHNMKTSSLSPDWAVSPVTLSWAGPSVGSASWPQSVGYQTLTNCCWSGGGGSSQYEMMHLALFLIITQLIPPLHGGGGGSGRGQLIWLTLGGAEFSQPSSTFSSLLEPPEHRIGLFDLLAAISYVSWLGWGGLWLFHWGWGVDVVSLLILGALGRPLYLPPRRPHAPIQLCLCSSELLPLKS